MGNHKRFSASGASRWMACPGSIKLVEQLLKEGKLSEENTSTPAADLGTAVHYIIEQVLLKKARASSFLDKTIKEGGMSTGVKITQTEIDSAKGCIRYVKRRKNDTKGEVFAERSFDMSKTYHRDIGGTSDITIISDKDKQLEIIDYKNGRWAVEVTNNPQLRIYALGAYYEFRNDFEIKKIRMTIYQPNKPGHSDGFANSEVISIESLLQWEQNILIPAMDAVDSKKPLFVSDPKNQCTWCEARPFCDTHHLSKTKIKDDVAMEKRVKLVEGRLPDPATLSIKQLLSSLENAEEMLSFYTHCKKHALKSLQENPDSVPGWKVGTRMGNRKLVSLAKVVEAIKAKGLKKEDVQVMKTMTVTEMEKKLKLDKNFMETITTRSQSSAFLQKHEGAVSDFSEMRGAKK